MGVLSNLEPKKVFDNFEKICEIPHGSFHTTAISNYLVDFAKAHNLKYRQDETENVIIWKSATPGYENAPTVLLQGHMDMVCEKNADCTKDMEKEGLDLFIDGDLVGARGTTLGADDGIALAMALSILESDDIAHGPLECLFTVGEEVGMIGAHAIDTSDLKAKYLLNLDSETDKVLTVSCAGMRRLHCDFPLTREDFAGDVLEVKVTGLVGGHSGLEIQLGRGNSNILMGRLLCEISKACDMRLVSVAGGAKDNAIPRETVAVIVADKKSVLEVAARVEKELKNEYKTTDKDVQIVVCDGKAEWKPMSLENTLNVERFLFCVPNGVIEMSADIEGLVQTSTNFGILTTTEEAVTSKFMARSSVNSQKDALVSKMCLLCESLGGKPYLDSVYSAWEFRKDSKLRDVMAEVYKEEYGREPVITAMHGGVECGILSGKMPEIDAVSVSPLITELHTPRERLHIESTGKVWNLVRETLKRLK